MLLYKFLKFQLILPMNIWISLKGIKNFHSSNAFRYICWCCNWRMDWLLRAVCEYCCNKSNRSRTKKAASSPSRPVSESKWKFEIISKVFAVLVASAAAVLMPLAAAKSLRRNQKHLQQRCQRSHRRFTTNRIDKSKGELNQGWL